MRTMPSGCSAGNWLPIRRNALNPRDTSTPRLHRAIICTCSISRAAASRRTNWASTAGTIGKPNWPRNSKRRSTFSMATSSAARAARSSTASNRRPARANRFNSSCSNISTSKCCGRNRPGSLAICFGSRTASHSAAIDRHAYDCRRIGALLLATSHETMLDALIERPLVDGDVLATANTLIYMGKAARREQVGTRPVRGQASRQRLLR